MIDKIQRLPLRSVWKHEAYDFTTWLQENLDVLNEVLEIELVSAEREQAAGPFSVDLVAEDASGATVIIENQLERSDHDHLGKLITYLTAFEAKVGVWIVADPRPEHARAIAWLNEATDASFYLLKAEAIRVGDSRPAPLLTVIAEPSVDAKSVGVAKRGLADRHHERHAFWTALLAHAKAKTRLHATIAPNHTSYLGTTAGRPGLSYVYCVFQHSARVELYIDRGRDAEEENAVIFAALHAHRAGIEATFGGPLEWQRLEDKRACRICRTIDDAGYRDPDRREWLIRELVDAMVSLDRALKDHIAAL